MEKIMTDEQAAAPRRLWQGIPGLERSPGGRLFAVWFSGGTHEPQPENTVYLTTSDNQGHSFAPATPMAGPRDGARAFDPTLWLDPLGRLWLIFNRGNPTTGLHGVYARLCADPDAVTLAWGEEFRLGFDEAPLSFRMNKPTVIATGEWILPVTHASEPTYAWFAEPKQLQGVGISTDQGKTWSLHGSLQAPHWALENMIVAWRDGRLWMLIRTGAGCLWQSHSADRGRTWTPAEATAIASPGSRFFIRRLASGNLLLVNHHRFTGRSHLTARLSDDDGRTWNEGLLLDERADVSYPDGVQAPDGVIRIVYDRDRKGEGDILMATFREEDVAAGRSVSGAVRLRQTINTLHAVRVAAQPVEGRTLLGLGVEAEPPPFPFRNPASLSAAACDAIQARAERRLRLLRPAVVRIFCFVEQWNPTLDGETFTWEHPDYLRLVRMLGVVRDLGGRANLVLFSHSHEPLPVLRCLVRAMVAMLAHLRGAHGFDHVAWLTLFNEPESVFRQDTPLARAIFTSSPVPHTWDEYVALNRLAMGLLQTVGLAGVRMVMPDSAWGGRMRRERMELTAAAFPHDDICFGYHHYNPEDPDFNDHAPPEFAYYGVREEAERFRRLVGPCRPLVVWEFNNAGDAFNTHFPGTDKRGRNVLESPEAGAELAYRVITALQYGADGLCLWHMHDSDVNKFGLWRWEDEGSTMRGYWHTYALLCHSFRPGWRVLPVSQPPETVSVLAACDAAGTGVRVAVQNRTAATVTLALDLPVGGGRAKLRRLDPETLPPPEREEPFYAESDETVDADGRVRLSLKPWELVVVDIGEPGNVKGE